MADTTFSAELAAAAAANAVVDAVARASAADAKANPTLTSAAIVAVGGDTTARASAAAAAATATTAAVDPVARVAAKAGARRIMQVGTRSGMLGPGGPSNGTDTMINSTHIHWLPAACTGIRYGFGGWWVNSNGPNNTEMPGTTTPTIKMGSAASIAAADTNRVFWNNGSISLVVTPDSLAVSDPIGRKMPAGSFVKSQVYVVSDSPTAWYRGRPGVQGVGERAETGTALTDKSLGASITSAQTYSYLPLLVLGIPDNPYTRSVALIGDSITAGLSGGENADGTYGWAGWPEKSLGLANPHSKFAIGGFFLSGWSTATARRYRRMNPIAQYFTDAFVALGTNDLYNNGGAPTLNLAQMQAQMTDLVSELQASGLTVTVSTIPPITPTPYGSTAWTAADGSDQSTSSAVEAIRLPYNAWLLAGGIPGAQVADAATAATMPGTTGKWRNGETGDGVHPNTPGAAAIATRVNLRQYFPYTGQPA